jgi:DNA repair protein RecN (Recombination protein N)
VIDDVVVVLEPGMTALTGETGAGKTLLVDALCLLLGGRADPSMVRAGTEEALVEGRFLRPDGEGGDGPSEILLARAVVRGGRSRAWIDGRMASIGALAEVASGLIELHGQHQHRTLVHTDAQRSALDAFGAIDLSDLEQARQRLKQLEEESAALGGDARQRAREADLLDYQISEIDGAAIEGVDEDGGLEVEEDRLAAAGAHRQAAARALDALSGEEGTGALDRLADAARALAGRAPLAPLESRVLSAMADLGDLAGELRSVVETWDDDPVRLEEIRARRQLLRELGRKYGEDLAAVLAFAADARGRREAIARDDRRARTLDAEAEEARSDLAAAGRVVADARREAAPRLAREIEATLRSLAMPSARFAVEVDGPGPADQVTFLLGANAGEPLAPLAASASGGELARTMLAIRLAVATGAGVMVFDEVDAGVGGAAATAVGAALAALGSHVQVLVVTHLAAVAAQADRQVGVRKSEHDGRTTSAVEVLGQEERVVELSRMLSGRPDSDSARRHARELLAARPLHR